MTRRAIIPTAQRPYYDEWQMSPGVVSEGLLFLTGMTGRRHDGSIADDPEEQIREAFARVGAVLAEAALGWSSVVEMTSYHVGLRDHLEIFRGVRAEHVFEPFAAWTAIEVAGFIAPGAIVELRVVADAAAGEPTG